MTDTANTVKPEPARDATAAGLVFAEFLTAIEGGESRGPGLVGVKRARPAPTARKRGPQLCDECRADERCR